MTTQHEEVISLAWTFGDRLRKLRRSLDMSSKEFAAALAIPVSTLAHYETDRSHPRDVVTFSKRVQLATGVDAKWLLGLNDDVPGPKGGGDDGGSESPLPESNWRPFHYNDNTLAAAA